MRGKFLTPFSQVGDVKKEAPYARRELHSRHFFRQREILSLRSADNQKIGLVPANVQLLVKVEAAIGAEL